MALYKGVLGQLLILALIFNNFQLIPAFTSVPLRLFHVVGSSTSCISAASRATQRIVSVDTTVPVSHDGDERPYGQRIYPVHPDDLSPEERRTTLMRMIMMVGMRDVMISVFMAVAFLGAGAEVDSYPVGLWLFSVIFARMATEDDISAIALNMNGELENLAPTIAAPRSDSLTRPDSFAQWRQSVVSPNIKKPSFRLGAGNLHRGQEGRRIAKFASDEPAIANPSGSRHGALPHALKLMSSMAGGFTSDVTSGIAWMASASSQTACVPPDENNLEFWDPRDPETHLD